MSFVIFSLNLSYFDLITFSLVGLGRLSSRKFNFSIIWLKETLSLRIAICVYATGCISWLNFTTSKAIGKQVKREKSTKNNLSMFNINYKIIFQNFVSFFYFSFLYVENSNWL